MTTEVNRRSFLAGSALLAGAAGIQAMAGSSFAQDPSAPGMARLSSLIPGAVDAAGGYALPPLPFPPEAVDAAIDKETMELHHGKHHAAYVAGLKKAEEKLAEARKTGDFDLVQHWSAQAAFHGGGHFLHCIFWDCMGPDEMGGAPTGDLAKGIERDFGGFDPMIAQFKAASKRVEGSGWGMLAYSFAAQKLIILQAQNQQLLTQWGMIPLLVLDVWEHAYYLRYKNDRSAYVEAFPKVINWRKISQRYEIARS